MIIIQRFLPVGRKTYFCHEEVIQVPTSSAKNMVSKIDTSV